MNLAPILLHISRLHQPKHKTIFLPFSTCNFYALVKCAVDGTELSSVQGCATDQEPVDVWHAAKFLRVRIVDAATVLDSDGVSDVFTHVLFQPCTDVCMGLLRLLRRGGKPSPNGPHWLVSDDNVVPGLGRVGTL